MSRRREGQATVEAKKKWEETQSKREDEKLKREKEEEKRARERVRQKIEQVCCPLLASSSHLFYISASTYHF